MSQIYRCQWGKCPHGAEPCEFSVSELLQCTKTTICPIGEEENIGFEINTEQEFFLLIVGSRGFHDYETLKTVADKMLSKQVSEKNHIVIVSGGADGADKLAEKYAHEHNYQLYVFEADWDQGKFAGFKRNKKMHEYIAKQQKRGVLAFWDGKSKGTAHSFELAKKYANPLKVYNYQIGTFQKV